MDGVPVRRKFFITGQLPIRTGLTTVGQAGADVGIPAEAATLATALKAQGYATGQFGKNHLGDLNKFLPTVHGFDEFFGYLYHLDAMSDPYWFSFPVDEKYYNTYGPRSLIHSFATDSKGNLFLGEVNNGQRYYKYAFKGMGLAPAITSTR